MSLNVQGISRPTHLRVAIGTSRAERDITRHIKAGDTGNLAGARVCAGTIVWLEYTFISRWPHARCWEPELIQYRGQSGHWHPFQPPRTIQRKHARRVLLGESDMLDGIAAVEKCLVLIARVQAIEATSGGCSLGNNDDRR